MFDFVGSSGGFYKGFSPGGGVWVLLGNGDS